jgi:hypothetical protein
MWCLCARQRRRFRLDAVLLGRWPGAAAIAVQDLISGILFDWNRFRGGGPLLKQWIGIVVANWDLICGVFERLA